MPELNAQENVALPLMISGTNLTEALTCSRNILSDVGLSKRFSHRPGELSGGEKQRVAVARALINSPSCLLMDEPTGDLDTNNAKAIADLVLDLVSEKSLSLIIATHDLSLSNRLDQNLNLENNS